jgi:hemerythrin-like domain-containing protein
MELYAKVPDFDEPIEALYICHENILARMDRIGALSRALLQGGPQAFAPQIEQWRELLSFVEHTVANHTKDEEEGLFPMLRKHLEDEVVGCLADHTWAEDTEKWLREQFEVFTSYPHTPSEVHIEQFARRAGELAGYYREHIEKENRQVFPMAKELLSQEQLKHLGTLMRKHRRIELHLPFGTEV